MKIFLGGLLAGTILTWGSQGKGRNNNRPYGREQITKEDNRVTKRAYRKNIGKIPQGKGRERK